MLFSLHRALNDNLQLLAKRRGQLKTVIQQVVQKAVLFVEEMNDPTLKQQVFTQSVHIFDLQ